MEQPTTRDRRYLGRDAYDAYTKKLAEEVRSRPNDRTNLGSTPAWDFLLSSERSAWHAAALAIVGLGVE